MKRLIRRLFRKKRYSTREQRENREKKTIIEIAKKVVEEENKTAKLNNQLDQKMSEFLNRTHTFHF
ncbi:hypothetical protein [Tenacibaculum xiamenense]|uniref:hypothetical protein n=1 Tax=Tenacibaculum xiamenense TaxID=1261553 RepID=UPI003895C989